MSLDFSSLFAGFVFGVFGLYLLRRGKTAANVPQIFIGLALMIYPYFIENNYLLWAIGFVLLFLGYRFK